MNINLHIDELVLDGFSPGDRYRIGEAVRLELTRLLAEQGVPPLARDSAITRLDGGAFEVAPTSKAEVIGARIAQQVYAGFGK